MNITNENNNTNKNRRRLFNRKININQMKPNKTDINKQINKKIRKLEGYDHTMGAITRNDVKSFLLDIESTLYNFNKSYLNEEFKNINKEATKYFNKVNYTYLNKLKRTIDIVAIKFSTFLTKNNYQILEKIIYKQFNKILEYITNYSDLIDNEKNNVINILNNSSILLEKLFNFSYNFVYNTYETFYNMIESKLEYLGKQRAREDKSKIRDKNDDEEEEDDEPGRPPHYDDKEQEMRSMLKFNELFGNSKSSLAKDVKEIFDFCYENDIGAETSISTNSFFFTRINFTSFGNDICKSFSPDIKGILISFKAFNYCEIALLIKPVIEAGICIGLGTDLNWKDKQYSFYIDVYGTAEVSLTLELGVYVIDALSPIQLSLSIGIKGVLGSGKAGMKLSLFMGVNRYDTMLYFELEAFRLSFYILLKFLINLYVYKFAFEFYIFNKVFGGLKFGMNLIKVSYYISSPIKILKVFQL